jgi:carbonic anhydrase
MIMKNIIITLNSTNLNFVPAIIITATNTSNSNNTNNTNSNNNNFVPKKNKDYNYTSTYLSLNSEGKLRWTILKNKLHLFEKI